MAFLVFDDGYRWLLKAALESHVPLNMRVEFCSGTDEPYYTTTRIKATLDSTLKIISLYSYCDEPQALKPCTHVIWKRTDNNQPIYKVTYEFPLPEQSVQICHIILNIDDVPSTNTVGYVAIPNDLIYELVEEDLYRVLAYELKKRCPMSPINIEPDAFYGVLTDVDISEDPTEVQYENHIEVTLADNITKAKLVKENDVLYLYLED